MSDMKRKQPGEGNSLSGDGKGMDMSGHENKPTERDALTNWRRQRERQVKTREETDSKEHSLPGDSRGRDKSGHGKKLTEQGALTSWRWQREGQVRTWKQTDQARNTHFLETVEGGTSQDMEEIDRVRNTHFLEMAEGGTSQDTKRNRPTEAHSLPGDGRGGTGWDMERNQQIEAHSLPGHGRGRDKLGHRKKLIDRGTLTSWRRQREGQIKAQKETDRRVTHFLEATEGGTSQDMERKKPSEGHLRPGEGRGRDKLGHRREPTEQGVLTSWRPQRDGQVRTQKERNRERGTHSLERAEGGISQDMERN